jgi:DNA primase
LSRFDDAVIDFLAHRHANSGKARGASEASIAECVVESRPSQARRCVDHVSTKRARVTRDRGALRRAARATPTMGCRWKNAKAVTGKSAFFAAHFHLTEWLPRSKKRRVVRQWRLSIERNRRRGNNFSDDDRGMISPETIAAIRDRVEIVAIVSETVKLTRKGRSYVGLCPFHKEKSPSFNVNAERGFFYCFGCKEKGTAFDFVMKAEGLTFPEAARRLAEHAGIPIEETTTPVEKREAEAAKRAIDDLYSVNQLAAHWFERQLREHPMSKVAWAELARRGLPASAPLASDGAKADDARADDALQAFRLGYAPPGWDALTLFLAQQGVSPMTAAKVGLIAPRKNGPGHYDWFRNRLLFAIIDPQGRVVGFSGRVLPDPETGIVDKQSPKYVNSPESPIYQKGQTLFGLYQARHAVRQQGEAIVVEGNFDVVSLHARGITNVVAPLGTAFTSAQAKLVRRYAPVLTLLFDGDAAGKKATREARETCRANGLDAKVAVLPGAKDPDDFVREQGADALRAAVKAARGILEHLIESLLDESFTRVDVHERASRVREIVQLISSEEDPTVRAMILAYSDGIAQRLGLPGAASFRMLRDSVAHALAEANQRPVARKSEGAPGERAASTSSHLSRAEEESKSAAPANDVSPWRARSRDRRVEIGFEMLGGILDFPDLLDDVDAEEALRELEGDAALAAAALAALQKNGQKAGQKFGQDVLEVLAQLPMPIHTFAAQRIAVPVHELREDAKRELVSNARKLKRLGLSRQKAHVVEALHRVERMGDRAAEDALLREMDRRAREKHGLKEG